jgi:hypothetical protein
MNLIENISRLKHIHASREGTQLSLFESTDFPVESSQSELEYIFEMVKNCSYVSKNFDYKDKATNTAMTYEDDNTTINAYASSQRHPEHDIHIFAGLSNSSKLMGAALAYYVENRDDESLETLRQACDLIGEKIKENGGQFTALDVSGGLELLNIPMTSVVISEANSYWFGSVLSVVGHELGHICLSHTVRGDWSNGVSRNDERQADLFAHSVVTTTPFAKYNVLSTLFTEVVFAWLHKNDSSPATTHPHSVERVMNTINSHEELLKGYGITRDNIDSFLPN